MWKNCALFSGFRHLTKVVALALFRREWKSELKSFVLYNNTLESEEDGEMLHLPDRAFIHGSLQYLVIWGSYFRKCAL